MSGFFGIYKRDGKSVELGIVQKMLNAMSYWEPDESGSVREGSVAFAHMMLWNTPESKQENLPGKQDHLIITMDARLDNREELAEQLDLTSHSLQQITDSTFILAAYAKWGEDCPKYLLGDFSFAIWDGGKKQLFSKLSSTMEQPNLIYCRDA